MPDDPSALFWFAPAGIHRFIVSHRYVQRVICANNSRISPPSTEAQSFHHCRRAVSFLCHCRDSRHPHLRAATWSGWWEDFPQQHKVCATVGRTLPLLYIIHGREYIPVVACPDRSPHPGNGPGQAAHTAQNRAKAGVGGMSGEMDGGTSPNPR